jgi:GxxExxY protein
MNTSEEKILYKDLSYAIVGLALDVHTKLGCGFLEKVYENSMLILLEKEKIPVGRQVPTPIFFEGQLVGDYFADIIVDGKIILELKAVDNISEIHRAQTFNYLKATGLRLAIILNFGKPKLQIERIVL